MPQVFALLELLLVPAVGYEKTYCVLLVVDYLYELRSCITTGNCKIRVDWRAKNRHKLNIERCTIMVS